MEAALADVTAEGGGKIPEDVAGGLSIVLKQSWAAKVRVLIHIADAPGHGHIYQDPTFDDECPGGDPTGLKLESLAGDIAMKKIAYFFVKVRATAAEGLLIRCKLVNVLRTNFALRIITARR